ncbi:MAG: 23S rRNA (adenine(2503)-C(2))-methyltransferase RlmN, partial [Acidobacteria bacterium]|nr:23S rRNA (adenine(2503)-C(2))-methyltransferase RlmN [Acidobacteriota bacterium]
MSDARTPLTGLSAPELQKLVAGLGEPEYRGRQLASWIYGKAETEFEAMLDLPTGLRAALAERHVVSPLHVAESLRSSDDVDKLLVHSGDGEVFECVLIPYVRRVSCCLSSQIGCPMGCTFCATGLGGFARNLTPGEIVGQYLLLQRLSERRIGHVVFMGMGEPLLNLDHLVKAMELLHEEVGLSYRHITVSTVGMVPQIRKLAELRLPIHLALSLHSPFDAVRDELMPVNRKWPVEEVVGALHDYQKATG